MNRIMAQAILSFLLCAAPATAQPRTAGEGPSGRRTMSLTGEWEFRIDPDDLGKTEGWHRPGVSFERKLAVPGAWNAQGVEFASESQRRSYDDKRLNGTKLLGTEHESDRLYHVYPGPGWYRRKVTIPGDWKGQHTWLVFEGVHRTADVWVNGNPVGSHIPYLSAFRFDVSQWAEPGKTLEVAVRVDARRNKAVDPLMGCMDTLDFLYASWGGIYRPVYLETTAASWVDHVFAAPRLADSTVAVHARRAGDLSKALPVTVEIRDESGSVAGRHSGTFDAGAAEATAEIKLAAPRLWSPATPHLYTAHIALANVDTASTRFGMREFKVDSGRFLLNGTPIFMRGYGDDCIFPNTIAPPPDREEYRRRLQTIKDYGFNYARHHSWMPMAEYLDVADELGMMVQPEFPIAYTWDLAATAEAKRMYLEEWVKMIERHRNHPSIVTWCMGNELYDSFDLAPEMYRLAKHNDPTRVVIDSDGCRLNAAGRSTLDFLVAQFNEAASCGFLDGKYDRIPQNIAKPVIAHEMGYFITLPDLGQLDLFKSGLRPYWLLEARDLAQKRNIQSQYARWVDASQKLQAVCLKSNFEAARRSRLSGFSQWLFQDYPNCAEGIVDMFFRPKALSGAEFRRFNAPTVLLLDAAQRSYRAGETAELKLLASRYEDQPTTAGRLKWELRSAGQTVASGAKENLAVNSDGLQELLPVSVTMPEQATAAKLTLSVELADENGKAGNDWNFWVFPKDTLNQGSHKLAVSSGAGISGLYPWAQEIAVPQARQCDLYVTTRVDAGVLDYLTQGGRVLLLAPEQAFPTAPSKFRPAGWDPQQKDGHTGIVLEKDHPALRAMGADEYCDLQFFHLLEGSKLVLLDDVPVPVAPIVRCLDMPQRFLGKAIVFEVSVGSGKLLVSGFNFNRAIERKDAAGMFLLDRFIRYCLSRDFAPQATLSADYLRQRVKP